MKTTTTTTVTILSKGAARRLRLVAARLSALVEEIVGAAPSTPRRGAKKRAKTQPPTDLTDPVKWTGPTMRPTTQNRNLAAQKETKETLS